MFKISGPGEYRTRPIKLIVVPDKASIGQAGAKIYQQQLITKPESNLGLATGSSVLGLYLELVIMAQAGLIDFSKVKTYNLDEYVFQQRLIGQIDAVWRGQKILTPEQFQAVSQSYLYFMNVNLFIPAAFNQAQFHLPDFRTTDPARTCLEYEQELRAAGRRDIQLLGIGYNGHIAFCEPGTPFGSITHVVQLSLDSRVSNSRLFMTAKERGLLSLKEDQDPHEIMDSWSEDQRRLFNEVILPRVPAEAMTMGISTIMAARKILMLVSGEAKATALRLMLTESPSEAVPASAVRCELENETPEEIIVLADQGAVTALPPQMQTIGEHIIL